MKNMIWELFYQTGNVDTYLLLKKLENEQLDDVLSVQLNNQDEMASTHTEM